MSLKSDKVLLYIIGPGYMVMGHSQNTLSYLAQHFKIIVASGPTEMEKNKKFDHRTLSSFTRAPSMIKDFYLIYEIYRTIKITKPEFVIYSTPKIAFFSMLICLYFKKPSLYIHRGAIYQNFLGIKRYVYKFIDRCTIKGASKTFFISQSLHQYVVKELNLTNLPYGRSYNSAQGLHPSYQEIALEEHVNNKVQSKTLKVGYLGRYSVDKGFDSVMEIAKSFKDKNEFNFIFKGMPDPDYKFDEKSLKSLNISFLPWDDNVINYLKTIDVLLFPSKREGFGNVCIQAAACGVPTIGIKGPGVNDAVADGVTGFLMENSQYYPIFASEIIENMQKNELKFCAKACRNYTIRNFDKDKITSEMAAHIKSVYKCK